MDVPGFKKENIQVHLDEEKKLLTVRGERSHEKEFEDEFRRVSERSFGSFSRSFTLPELCNLKTQPKANMENGVLKIRVMKNEQAPVVPAGKRIQIA